MAPRPPHAPPGLGPGPLDPRGTRPAARAIRLVDEQVARLGLDAGASADVAWRLRQVAPSTAAHLRAVGHHDEASRVIRRFSNLADEGLAERGVFSIQSL